MTAGEWLAGLDTAALEAAVVETEAEDAADRALDGEGEVGAAAIEQGASDRPKSLRIEARHWRARPAPPLPKKAHVRRYASVGALCDADAERHDGDLMLILGGPLRTSESEVAEWSARADACGDCVAALAEARS